jgi:hypothetical protein
MTAAAGVLACGSGGWDTSVCVDGRGDGGVDGGVGGRGVVSGSERVMRGHLQACQQTHRQSSPSLTRSHSLTTYRTKCPLCASTAGLLTSQAVATVVASTREDTTPIWDGVNSRKPSGKGKAPPNGF